MLLGALGYKASNEGIGGTGWEIATTKLAIQAGVATAEDLTATFNRDMAAKMAFKTLTATEVTYEGGSTVTINGATITTGATRKEVVGSADVNYDNATKGDKLMQFCEDHFKDLKKVSSTTADYYGRPGAQWTYGKTNATVGVYSTKTPVASYTTTVSANELYKTLGSKAVLKATGSTVNTLTADSNKILKADGTQATDKITVSDKATGIGGAGIVTEIYATDTANEYIVVQIQPKLAQVTNVKNVKATATTGAYTQYTIAGKTYEVYTSTVSGDETDTLTINGTIAKNDWVMIYGYSYPETKGDDYAVVAPATTVTGKLTGYTSSTNSYTIDGTAYPKSAAAAVTGVNTAFNAYNQSATYAIDTYGNVVGSVTVTTANNYVFVVANKNIYTYNSETSVMTPAVQATVVTTDGELKTITISNAQSDALNGKVCTYTVNNKGVYTLVSDLTTGAAKDTTFNVTSVTKNNAALATNKYANAATKYYVVNKTTTDGVDTYTGVSAYTGYANVPSLNLSGVSAVAVDADKNGIAEVVFVMPTTETVSDNLVYVTGSYSSDGTKTTYDVIVKGEATKMVLNDLTTGKVTKGLYNVTDGNATAATTKPLYMTYNNGLFQTCETEDGTYTVGATFNGATLPATVAADVAVYTLENGTCETTTAADLSATGSADVVIVTTTSGTATTISAIYIVK